MLDDESVFVHYKVKMLDDATCQLFFFLMFDIQLAYAVWDFHPVIFHFMWGYQKC